MTIYFDDHATTPCDPRVLEAMLPYFGVQFANPSSVTHLPGRQAADTIEQARERVAALLNASPQDVVFTSGSTESNNLAIYGVARAAGQHSVRRRIITLPTEHKAVLEPCRDLSQQGFDVVYAPVDHFGMVNLDALKTLATPETLLVSIQAANSEIGTVQPLREIAEIAKQAGALFHCDATQAVGRVLLDWQTLPIDLLSLSGHKLYGPKGSGALIVRKSVRQTGIAPLMRGGGQEGGLRPGTHNVPAIVGLAAACTLMHTEGEAETLKIQTMRNKFEVDLQTALPKARFNGHPIRRLPGNISITLPGIEADALLLNIPQYALSLGSACNSGALEPSYVLTSVGLSRQDADSTFRVGIGRFSLEENLNSLVHEITNASERLYSLNI